MTAALLLLVSSVVYFLSLQYTHGHFFTRLKVRASIAASSHFESNNVRGAMLKLLRERHLEQLSQEHEFFFKDDERLAQTVSDSLPEVPHTFIATIKKNGFAQYHTGYVHFSGTHNPENNYIVVVSAYDDDAESQMNFLRNLLVFTFLFSCILVFVLGRIFAFRIMAPISSIVTRVNDITASNLSDRVQAGNGNDELGEIANTFNNMLDRLETTFELQSNFISNASHELKTPLTAILGEAEIILQSPRTTEEYQVSIHTIQQEAIRLNDLTSSLLSLSQISYDGKKQKIEPVLMDELLMSIKINLDKRVRDNQVKILIGQTPENPDVFMLNCVRVWMELALTNIINNSIKYSDNKEVLVTLSANKEDFFIHISDSGIGIPNEEIKHIFEPFFRASNTFHYTGYGIGLPLASKIIRLHGGKINIHSKPQVGTKVSLQFPQNPKIKI
jgi:signal transduction histidine kinase